MNEDYNPDKNYWLITDKGLQKGKWLPGLNAWSVDDGRDYPVLNFYRIRFVAPDFTLKKADALKKFLEEAGDCVLAGEEECSPRIERRSIYQEKYKIPKGYTVSTLCGFWRCIKESHFFLEPVSVKANRFKWKQIYYGYGSLFN